MLINYEDEPILNDHRFIIDDEDEDNFHDTYDDPIVLLTEVAKEQLAKRAEIDALRAERGAPVSAAAAAAVPAAAAAIVAALADKAEAEA